MGDKLDVLFSEIFGDDIDGLVLEDLSMDTLGSWDSLNHLRLLMAVEDEFSTNLAPSDFQDLICYSDIKDFLKNEGKI